MRQYLRKLENDEYEDAFYMETLNSLDSIREELWMHFDDTCYWAIKDDSGIRYSQDDLFSSEKLDSTGVVIFMK